MSGDLRLELGSLLGSLYPGAPIEPVAGDASTRRFFRLRPAGAPSLVVMDYGAPFERETDDVRLARIFEDAGLPVARIRHVCPAAGCLVLEDLGDRTLEALLAEPAAAGAAERERIYLRAIALALDVASRGTAALERSGRALSPSLDADRFRFEMEFFLEHYAGALKGVRPPPDGLRQALHVLAERAAACPRPVLCHRDYHSRNLMVRDDGSLAMVDIQDARRGPLGYDLASLVYDAYADIGEPLRASLIESYRRGLQDPPPRSWLADRLAVVAAQRMIKALGTFGYQAAVLGRRRYLEGVPRTLDRLARLLPASGETATIAAHLGLAGLLDPLA